MSGSACLPVLLARLPSSDPLIRTIRPLISFLNAIRYYALDEPTNPSSEENLYSHETDYSNWLIQYKTTGNAGDSVTMGLLNMALEHPDKLEEIEELLDPAGLGLIEIIDFKRLHSERGELKASERPKDFDRSERKFYFLAFRPSHDPGGNDAQFAFNTFSSGTRRIIRILTYMLFDRNSVMLIEHPEDGIHRSLLIKLISLLRSYADPRQFILSSHSPVVFNSLGPDAVRVVTMHNGVTRVRALSTREVTAAENYMSDDGALSDFLEIVQPE